MSFAYTKAKFQMLSDYLAAADVRAMLVMTNTTADTDQDVATIGNFGTRDEFDGSGYSAGGAALSGEAVNQDDANDRAEFDAADLTFATLGAGTRQIQALVLYKFNTSVALSQPVAFIDTGGFPISANGGDVTMQWNAEGIVQAT